MSVIEIKNAANELVTEIHENLLHLDLLLLELQNHDSQRSYGMDAQEDYALQLEELGQSIAMLRCILLDFDDDLAQVGIRRPEHRPKQNQPLDLATVPTPDGFQDLECEELDW